MRVLTSAALAALILSSPALASERGGGHRPPSPPPGHCGGGCRPPAPNINVNVNANASASAGASARSYINARAWSSGYVHGAVGGGTIISGGGYAGDYGYGLGGGYVHVDSRPVRLAPASAPYGYVVHGFGRDYPVGGPWMRRDDRYGREGRWREEEYRRDEFSEHYERWESSEEYRRETAAAWEFEIIGRESRAYDRGYDDGRADCDCRPEPRHEEPPHAWASPNPPHHEPEASEYRYEPGPGRPYYGDLPPPDAEPMAPPPRHNYRQEPGERG